MKLPNDLIKATDYSKAKEREIHMFEYVNGKYIQYYTLNGKHEMTPQEIVNCLNAIATLDCDLATAYVFVKGQNEKIADLQHRLKTAEKALELACNISAENDKAYKSKTKWRTPQRYVKMLKEKAESILKEE